ncbi:hypothetical protein ACE2EI_000727 [Salmonella enterica]
MKGKSLSQLSREAGLPHWRRNWRKNSRLRH